MNSSAHNSTPTEAHRTGLRLRSSPFVQAETAHEILTNAQRKGTSGAKH